MSPLVRGRRYGTISQPHRKDAGSFVDRRHEVRLIVKKPNSSRPTLTSAHMYPHPANIPQAHSVASTSFYTTQGDTATGTTDCLLSNESMDESTSFFHKCARARCSALMCRDARSWRRSRTCWVMIRAQCFEYDTLCLTRLQPLTSMMKR